MSRPWYAGFSFFVIAPLVVIVLFGALSLTVLSSYENFRLGSATDQFIRAVDLARDLRLSSSLSAEHASSIFFARVKQVSPSEVIELSGPFLGSKPSQALINPWGEPIAVVFYPDRSSIRFETKMSSTACRRLLSLFAKEVDPLGITRVDVRTDGPGNIWRLLYEKKPGGQPILSSEAIYGGCGDSGHNILSLTFSL